jgi:hypothetical protein
MGLAEKQWSSLVDYATHGGTVHRIDARVLQTQRPLQTPSGAHQPVSLIFQYVLHADMAGVRIPRAVSPARADELWKHTCFEAFISASGMAGYYELNFSPSGQWALYSFDGYRKGMSPVDVTTPPKISVRSRGDRLELEAEVSLFDLALARWRLGLRLALTAVVEDDSGRLSYWALKHAPGKPDFHHSDGFVLELIL